MRVKKFVAPTMPEAMKLIRKDLGADAVILSSKEVRKGGFLGLFKQKRLEVIAALDPQPIVPKEKPRMPVAVQQSAAAATSKAQPDKNGNERVMQELHQLKKMVAAQKNSEEDPAFDGFFQDAYNHLLQQEVDEQLAKDIIVQAMSQLQGTDRAELDQVCEQVQQEITARLDDVPFTGITYQKKVLQFAGPTGVGKTTTIAKLAARSMLRDGKKVAFITADTYRIAAIDQLKTYAKILDIPIEVAYSEADYERALTAFSDYDLILVDTAGRNFRDSTYISELKKNLTLNDDTEIHLVLSLTAKAKDLEETFKQFSKLPVQSIVFTKLDETGTCGSMLNLLLQHKMGVSYITNGQDVPDDLETASADKISSLIAGGICHA